MGVRIALRNRKSSLPLGNVELYAVDVLVKSQQHMVLLKPFQDISLCNNPWWGRDVLFCLMEKTIEMTGVVQVPMG